MTSNETAALQGIDKAKAETPNATANMKGRRMATNKTVVRQILDKARQKVGHR